ERADPKRLLRFKLLDEVPRLAEEKCFTLAALRHKALDEFQQACERHGVTLSVTCLGDPADAERLICGLQDVLEETTVLVLRFLLRGAPPRQINVTLGIDTGVDGALTAVATGTDASDLMSLSARAVPGLTNSAAPGKDEAMDLSLAVAMRLAALTEGTLTGLHEPGVGHRFEYRLPVRPG
ncbi:MAG: hypothetical protein HRU31_15510, partial [Rhodobacteraceae bacterium]|nr:hypothetical protein [Paracoccaceae bacterium]